MFSLSSVSLGHYFRRSTIRSVLVVFSFIVVFSIDLPNTPRDQDINFSNNLEPNTHPISIHPYKMAPIELRELKFQLRHFLSTGYIHLSA